MNPYSVWRTLREGNRLIDENETRIPRTGWLLGIAVSVLAGAIAGFLVDVGSDFIPRNPLILYPAAVIYGIVIGHIVIHAFGTQPDARSRAMSALAVATGAVGGRMLVGIIVLLSSSMPHPRMHSVSPLMLNVLSPVMLLCVAATIVGLLARFRMAGRKE